MLKLRWAIPVCGSFAALAGAVVYAQTFPVKPIRIITSGVGGGSDFAARLIGQGISGPLGQQVVVENRSGAAVTGELVSKAPPDGYTLLLLGNSFWVGPLIQRMPYDAVKDFSPVTLATKQPNILVVHPSLPVKSTKELIALAKASPGQLNYSAGQVGSSSHLAAEVFCYMAGVKMVRISYSGPEEIVDLVSGQVQLTFGTAVTVGAHAKSGKLRALAVTSPVQSTLLPGLPTVASSGLPGYESESKMGIFAPARTAASVVERLNREIVRVLNVPEVKAKFAETAVETVGSSPEQLATIVASEVTKLDEVIKAAHIRQ